MIFIGSRRFADEHQLRARIAHAEDDLLAALLGQAAAGAIADVFANGEQAPEPDRHSADSGS